MHAPSTPIGSPATPTPDISIGSPAPNFTLPDQHGADYALPNHQSPRTHQPHQSHPLHHPPHLTLLVFYPFAFSRICGGELRELQSALPDLERRETALVAVSCDPTFALRVYAEQEAFSFPLLSDFWPHGAVARAYGVFDETRGCARRGSFLIDQDGIVRWSVVNPISEPRPLADYFSALTHAAAH